MGNTVFSHFYIRFMLHPILSNFYVPAKNISQSFEKALQKFQDFHATTNEINA